MTSVIESKPGTDTPGEDNYVKKGEKDNEEKTSKLN